MTDLEAPPSAPNLYEASVSPLGWKVWYKHGTDPTAPLPSDDDEGTRFSWINLDVVRLIDKVRFILSAAVILYTLIFYWLGVLDWALSVIDDDEAASYVATFAYLVILSPSFLQYINFVLMLSRAVGIKEHKKSRSYRFFEWLNRNVSTGQGICVPYSTVADSVQQLHQGLVQNVPFLVLNILLPLVFQDFFKSTTVGEKSVMKLCPAQIALMLTLLQSRGLCYSRSMPLILQAGGLINFIPLKHRFGGVEIVKFCAAAGGPYFDFVDGEVYLAQGWDVARTLEAMKKANHGQLLLISGISTPLWVWSVHWKSWAMVATTYALVFLVNLVLLIPSIHIALPRAVRRREQLDTAITAEKKQEMQTGASRDGALEDLPKDMLVVLGVTIFEL